MNFLRNESPEFVYQNFTFDYILENSSKHWICVLRSVLRHNYNMLPWPAKDIFRLYASSSLKQTVNLIFHSFTRSVGYFHISSQSLVILFSFLEIKVSIHPKSTKLRLVPSAAHDATKYNGTHVFFVLVTWTLSLDFYRD